MALKYDSCFFDENARIKKKVKWVTFALRHSLLPGEVKQVLAPKMLHECRTRGSVLDTVL